MRNFTIATALSAHNVGGRGGFPFNGSMPGYHNVGASEVMDFVANMGGGGGGGIGLPPVTQPASTAAPTQCPTCPPNIDPRIWAAVFRRFGAMGCGQLCNLSGGNPGLGYGGMCPSPTPPAIPVDARGCSQGWLQCKQPIAVRALAVAAGASVQITVTPRRVARAYQFYYSGAASTFEIAAIEVDGTQYLGSGVPIPADRYNAQVTDHSIDVGEFSSTTPLLITVTNFTVAAADFRGTLDVAASRS